MFFRTRFYLGIGSAIALTVSAVVAAGWPSRPSGSSVAAVQQQAAD